MLPIFTALVNRLHAHHARVYAVGGAVRDVILGLEVHDLDVEVHGITGDHLQEILATAGAVHLEGKSFGSFRVNGLSVDWVLPRRDSSGRKPVVEVDHALTIEQALKRRDLTMNAMAVDLSNGHLIDPYGGYQDLLHKILVTPDVDFFIQDPLRFYRVMQFIARFKMYPDAELERVCKNMDISHLSSERIHAEFDKLFTLSSQPSLGIRWLKQIDRLPETLPELAATVGSAQEPQWHPEGDVFEHSMQALDAAAAEREMDREQHMLICYAALCHDLGKVTTTRVIDGRLRSFGHEQAGVAPARALCARLTGGKKMHTLVPVLVLHHMKPAIFAAQNALPKAYKKLAYALAPDLNLYLLAQVAYADKRGRSVDGLQQGAMQPLRDIDTFIERAREYGVLYAAERPLVTGADLLPLGFSGPALGRALKKVYEYQITQREPNKETLLRYVQRMVK